MDKSKRNINSQVRMPAQLAAVVEAEGVPQTLEKDGSIMRFNRYVVYGKWIIGLLLLMPCYSSANCEDSDAETLTDTKKYPKQRCIEEFSVPLPSSTIRSWKCCNTTVTLSRSGTLVVKGVGEMEDYNYRRGHVEWREYSHYRNSSGIYAPWLDFDSLITNLIIEDGVTHIGDFTFTELYALKSVTIPASVSSIGMSAFEQCKNLTSVAIPGNMRSIKRAAFKGCENLTSVTFSENVAYIGSSAFAISGLTSITIPNNDEIYIDEQAFAYCTGLTSVTLPKSEIELGDFVFSGCKNLTSIIIRTPVPPRRVTTYIFWDINLNDVCLFVPANSLHAYLTAHVWKEFSCVRELDEDSDDIPRTWLAVFILTTALILFVAIFIIIRRLRKSSRKKSV